MKKTKHFNACLKHDIIKALLFMKLTIALLLISLVQVSANGLSQSITLKLNNAELKKALFTIEKKTNCRFLYNDDAISGVASKVNINVENLPVTDVLDKIFKGTNLSYRVLDNHLIVLSAKDNAIQDVRVKGRITDANGASVPGATVRVKGTNVVTSADNEGRFSIPAPDNATLVISSIGFTEIEVAVGGRTEINITLAASTKALDQVVVVGYGTSRARDLTAPLTVVKSEDLVKRTTATPMDALQGAVAGVQVVSNGAPGNGPTVRIRGVGSLNNEGPLYVVDGMFFDNIDFLNTNDIEDMSILKDASGAAIYGVKAANGVVLITTRKGKLNMKPKVTYNGYIGFQTPAHLLKMANGAQYAAMELAKQTTGDSSHVLLSASKFGGSGVNPTTNTDWYNELLRKTALIHNHSIDITGGSDKVSYSFGLNYLYQDGIMDANNNFNRLNIHAQTEAKVYDWLKVGYNVLVSNSTLLAPNNGAWANAYKASPLYPVFDPTNTSATPTDYASSTSLGYGNGVYGNPVAAADYYFDKTKAFQVNPVIYAELALLKNNKLTFKTQLSQKYVSNVEVNYIPQYKVDAYQYSTDNVSHLTSTQNRYTNYIVDNLLTYKDFKKSHHWSVLLGQSSREERWRQTQVQATNVPNDEHYYYVTNGTTSATGYSEDGTDNKSVSFFARATYDYASKYFLTATYRADGSNKYQTTWGYFPSVGLGWVISKEDFMKSQHLFDFLKARVSWGKLGNDAIPANAAYAKAQSGNSYSGIYGSSGASSGSYVPGYVVNGLYSNIGWEVVEEWDGGFDFSLIRSRLTGSVDYYHRMTNNLAFSKSLPMTGTTVYGNWGKVLNEGVELSLNWADKISKDWSYHIGGNITTVKNTVKDLGGLSYMMTGISEFPTRIQVGQSLNYFYGYQVAGIYQSQAEVNADPAATGQGVMAGYFKYIDQNKSGSLTSDSDRVNLGSYLPKITYGINLGFEYKNFDFSVLLQGQAGNKILNMNRARRNWYSDMNGDADFVSNLWTGSGSTNQYPSAYASTQGWNYLASSFYVESGSYLRIQNIQVGYNLTLGKAKDAPKMRLYLTADRPLIFTKYKGFTPEVTGSINSIQNTGYDEQVYPTSATYSFGCRITY